jgi:hypothetical protein
MEEWQTPTRIAELRQEIAQIHEANQNYTMRNFHSMPETAQHSPTVATTARNTFRTRHPLGSFRFGNITAAAVGCVPSTVETGLATKLQFLLRRYDPALVASILGTTPHFRRRPRANKTLGTSSFRARHIPASYQISPTVTARLLHQNNLLNLYSGGAIDLWRHTS